MDYINSKKWIFAGLGFLVVILPALGFPRMMKDFLFVADGIAILWLSLREPDQKPATELKEPEIKQ